MALGDAIKEALDGRSQAWLAGELGIDQGHLSRVISGKVENLSLDLIVRIEKALDLERGVLLRAGGYVSDSVTLSAAVETDPGLTREQRSALRGLIRTWKV